jgi:hypothetical protein
MNGAPCPRNSPHTVNGKRDGGIMGFTVLYLNSIVYVVAVNTCYV